MGIQVRKVTKEFAQASLGRIASIRIDVFREFPYIYNGSLDYEVTYLSRYFKAENSAFVLAFDENADQQIVGVATCLPLIEEDDFVKQTFIQNNLKCEEYFYFGESVLLPEYRGQGIGHLFFNEREKHALSFPEIKYTTFCAVDRPSDHPFKPLKYRTLHSFWESRGYALNKDLHTEFEWLDLGQSEETKKQMNYWVKKWK